MAVHSTHSTSCQIHVMVGRGWLLVLVVTLRERLTHCIHLPRPGFTGNLGNLETLFVCHCWWFLMLTYSCSSCQPSFARNSIHFKLGLPRHSAVAKLQWSACVQIGPPATVECSAHDPSYASVDNGLTCPVQDLNEVLESFQLFPTHDRSWSW